MKFHQVPSDWKKTLSFCKDFDTWLVFADYLEEIGDPISNAVRFLAETKRMPKEYRGFRHNGMIVNYVIEDSGVNKYKWDYHYRDKHQSWQIPRVVYDKLPGFTRMVDISNSGVQEPILYAKHYRTILKAYLVCAKALTEELKDIKIRFKSTGGYPNWTSNIKGFHN